MARAIRWILCFVLTEIGISERNDTFDAASGVLGSYPRIVKGGVRALRGFVAVGLEEGWEVRHLRIHCPCL